MIRRLLRCPAAVLTVVLALGSVHAGPAVAAAVGAPSVPSTTTLSVEGTVAAPVPASYGQPLTAAAHVVVPGAAPDGWVFFVVDGLSRRTDVAADGTASTTIEGLRTGTHRVSATFVPRDPLQQDGSTSAETTVEVSPVVPRAVLRVSGRRVDRVLRVRVRMRTPYATEATGRVAVTLDRRGPGGSRTRRVVLVDSAAGLALGRVEAGRYRVVVRYPGDSHTAPASVVRQVTVRRR